MQAKVPKDLNELHFKFFNGKVSFQDIGYMLIGLPFAIPIGIIFSLFAGTGGGFILGIIITLIGIIIGRIKVFNMPLLKALFYINKYEKIEHTLHNINKY